MSNKSTINSTEREIPDVLVDPGDSTVDIVFVHGLGGDKEGTWTWTSPEKPLHHPERVLWPRDLLPKDIPHARIISFGYDASFAHFYPFYGPRNVPQGTTLDDHSTALFQRLIALEDKSSSKRPIIFVTHSLGGLVTANALSRPNGTDTKKDEIADRTVGVIFLGTPFEGTKKARWAATALRLLSFVSSTNDEKVKDLEERSAKLISINDAFYKYLRMRDRSNGNKNLLEVACFFEEYPMKIGGKKVHIVPKESASLKGIDPQSISAHHSDMCKFEDEYRNGYKCILDQLQLWIKDLGLVAAEGMDTSQGHKALFGDVNYSNGIHNLGGTVAAQINSVGMSANHVIGTDIVRYHDMGLNEMKRSLSGAYRAIPSKQYGTPTKRPEKTRSYVQEESMEPPENIQTKIVDSSPRERSPIVSSSYIKILQMGGQDESTSGLLEQAPPQPIQSTSSSLLWPSLSVAALAVTFGLFQSLSDRHAAWIIPLSLLSASALLLPETCYMVIYILRSRGTRTLPEQGGCTVEATCVCGHAMERIFPAAEAEQGFQLYEDLRRAGYATTMWIPWQDPFPPRERFQSLYEARIRALSGDSNPPAQASNVPSLESKHGNNGPSAVADPSASKGKGRETDPEAAEENRNSTASRCSSFIAPDLRWFLISYRDGSDAKLAHVNLGGLRCDHHLLRDFQEGYYNYQGFFRTRMRCVGLLTAYVSGYDILPKYEKFILLRHFNVPGGFPSRVDEWKSGDEVVTTEWEPTPLSDSRPSIDKVWFQTVWGLAAEEAMKRYFRSSRLRLLKKLNMAPRQGMESILTCGQTGQCSMYITRREIPVKVNKQLHHIYGEPPGWGLYLQDCKPIRRRLRVLVVFVLLLSVPLFPIAIWKGWWTQWGTMLATCGLIWTVTSS